jgi:hypothetical protein
MLRRLSITAVLCACALAAQTPAPKPLPNPVPPTPNELPKPGANQSPQPESPEVEPPLPFIKRFSFGFRVRAIPHGFFRDRTVTFTTTSNDLDYSYVTESTSPYTGIGPAIEFLLRRNVIIGIDFLHHTAKYKETKTVVDSDEKTEQTVETTRVRYWDIPLHVQWLGPPRLPRRAFVTGGGVVRMAGHIRTGNEYSYKNGTTAYNELPTRPAHKSLYGATAGLGFRLVDGVGIKLTPELRYTRWFGTTFHSVSTRSQFGQLEALIGLTF